MPTFSSKTGLRISAVLGLVLSLASVSVESMPECPFFGWQPFCGGIVGGAPLGYFPFNGASNLPEVLVALLSFALNTVFWTLPFFLAFALLTFALRRRLFASAWVLWIFELLLLAPLLLQMAAYLVQTIGNIQARDFSYNVYGISDIFGQWLRPANSTVEALDTSITFALVFYASLVLFSLSLVLISIYKTHGRIYLRYPVAAVIILLLPAVLYGTSLVMKGGPFGPQEYPFQVLDVSLKPSLPMDPGSGRQLHYQLRFFKLPQSGKTYNVSFFAYDDYRIWQDEHQVAAGFHADFLQQKDGMIYGIAPGTTIRDNKFVVRDVVEGTMDIPADAQPKYLSVWIYDAEVQGSVRLFAYLVPIRP